MLDQRKPPTLYRSSAAKYNSPEMSDSSNYSSERTYTETQENDLYVDFGDVFDS